MTHAFENADFQERLHVINDAETGVTGIIAIHSTAIGPAAGGCRLWHYDTQTDLVTDAIRLARGMSYKNAMAGLPFGGGKAVLQRPEGDFDRAALFRVFGEAVAALKGAYITAEDVGTTIADMRAVRRQAPYVAGLEVAEGMAGGDPSPWTALGVFESMKAAAQDVLKFDLAGATVAVQGVGNVGGRLCRLLRDAGANLIVADVDKARAAALAAELGAKHVGIDEILVADADILAPCALGGVLNADSIPDLRVRLVCGGANNQLATEADGQALVDRGILYAPDYVVNAGGIINVSAEYLGETSDQVADRVGQIAGRLLDVFRRSTEEQVPPGVMADRLAQHLIASARRRQAA
ncbi:Glu/Leu/Phe/Val dehydrogenase [Sphingobium amiense]|uniref:Glu/Leu/Phe/Val dehydrogenase n=1 Tax=Sphingobium amiense TaxID=135719 RepID=A0A494WCU4_9SPHN|nr:Glu/Leu/Phe/Val dehydrogenase dimerization domain-containing protein [Sphingobium amiense]BBD98129.1 Glu/Leu/Phe/Val dehydrogenase [Sphingobium amiense]